MPSGFQILIAIAFTVAVIAGIARHDYWKRKKEYTGSVEVKNRYKRTVRRIDGVLVTSIILGLVFTFLQPDETVKQTEKVGSESSANLELDNKDTATVDTNLVMGELTPLPEVPAEYTDRYNEVNEVISRTDGLLTLIKKNMSECNGPCSDLPLEEIQTRFDAMEELIATSRNQLQKASEIVNEMAQEDPPELHTQKLFELEQELLATRYSLETMLLADSWESWAEPVEYAESTRVKRLYKVPLEETVLGRNYYVEGSTKDNGEPITNEESPEALQSAENVIVGFMEIEDEINDLSDSVYASMDADFLTADTALAIIESTREQAVIAANSFNDVEASKELSGAIGKLDELKEKLNKYESVLEKSEWNEDTYDDVLLIVDSFYEDLEYNPVTVKQFLEVYGY